ncbi:Pre-mRNA-splicing regulator female-lethal(2)D [Gryllus bimaculatus]|nr:Pre-mRNA-splicing regulator female-lethal(2)D [Gryllus bimaculatus]
MAEESSAVSAPPPAGIHNRLGRRVKLSEQQLENINRDELLRNWRELDSYVDILETQAASQEVLLAEASSERLGLDTECLLAAELASLRDSEERAKQQHLESTHREKVLVRRLATKEQEMQEYVNQIAELKAAQAPGAAALRSALLDPAVNLLLQRLRQELLTTRARLEETQNELSAWKFTPDSNTGKRLMAKCRLLYQENEELGQMISSGRLAKLEGDLALQKSFSEEVKKSQSELDEFLQDLDEDVEGMQSTIYYLQQELRKSKEAVQLLQQENSSLKSGNLSSLEQRPDALGNGDASRSTLCHNGAQEKGSDEARGWGQRTKPFQQARTPSPRTQLETEAVQEQGGEMRTKRQASGKSPRPALEEDSVSCDVATPEHVRPRSPQDHQTRTFDESDESMNVHPHSPPASAPQTRAWQRPKCNHDSSSDSEELILKLDADDIGEDESEDLKGDNDRNDVGSDSELRNNIKSSDHEARNKGQSPNASEVSLRKRTCPSDDSSNDSDNVPLIKKVRRDSEISLHYHEDEDDETGLTNGETTMPAEEERKLR